MDEEDAEWLAAYNAPPKSLSPAPKPKPRSSRKPKAGRPRKRPKSPPPPLAVEPEPEPARPLLSEDELEWIMGELESSAERAGLNAAGVSDFRSAWASSARLTDLDDLRPQGDGDAAQPVWDNIRTTMSRLSPLHSSIYPHWQSRRSAHPCRPLTSQLIFTESPSTPTAYVCFRHRDPPPAEQTRRKTRRTDARQRALDSLVPLRDDLYQVRELMRVVAESERLKLKEVLAEELVFEGRTQLRELKRAAGEPEGDEELLVVRKRARPSRAVEEAISAAARKAQGMQVHFRLGQAQDQLAQRTARVDEFRALVGQHTKERQHAEKVERKMEVEIRRGEESRREEEDEWEDLTCGGYEPSAVAPGPDSFWRRAQSASDRPDNTLEREDSAEEGEVGPSAVQLGAGPVYRHRVGRNGRHYLDRAALHPSPCAVTLAPSSEDDDDDEDPDTTTLARQAERARYDLDALDACPLAGEPAIVDDYAMEHLVRRCELVKSEQVGARARGATLVDPPGVGKENGAEVDENSETVKRPLTYLEQALAWEGPPQRRAEAPEVRGRRPYQTLVLPRGLFDVVPKVNGSVAGAGLNGLGATGAAGQSTSATDDQQARAIVPNTPAAVPVALGPRRIAQLPQQSSPSQSASSPPPSSAPVRLVPALNGDLQAQLMRFTLANGVHHPLPLPGLSPTAPLNGLPHPSPPSPSSTTNRHHSRRTSRSAISPLSPIPERGSASEDPSTSSSPRPAISFPMPSSVLPLRVSPGGRASLPVGIPDVGVVGSPTKWGVMSSPSGAENAMVGPSTGEDAQPAPSHAEEPSTTLSGPTPPPARERDRTPTPPALVSDRSGSTAYGEEEEAEIEPPEKEQDDEEEEQESPPRTGRRRHKKKHKKRRTGEGGSRAWVGSGSEGTSVRKSSSEMALE